MNLHRIFVKIENREYDIDKEKQLDLLTVVISEYYHYDESY